MSKGNVARELNKMVPGRAAVSTDVYVMYAIPGSIGQPKILQGYTLATAESTLSALCESKGRRFAINALIQCVHSDATLTCVWINTSSVGSTPSFTAVNSATY